MAEKEPEKKKIVFEKFSDIKKGVNGTATYDRTVGNHNYKIEINEINGDQYEDLTLDVLEKVGERGNKYDKMFSYELKKLMFITVAGEKYDANMDRDMPMWMRMDVDKFLMEYAGGNL